MLENKVETVCFLLKCGYHVCFFVVKQNWNNKNNKTILVVSGPLKSLSHETGFDIWMFLSGETEKPIERNQN